MRREFSVLAEGRHIFGRRPKPRAAKHLTETGNRARKVSGKFAKKRYSRQGKLIVLKIMKMSQHNNTEADL